MIKIEQGATTEAALDGMIDSMTDCDNFLIADWCAEREMAVERHIDYTIISYGLARERLLWPKV